MNEDPNLVVIRQLRAEVERLRAELNKRTAPPEPLVLQAAPLRLVGITQSPSLL